jgi:hypothetical protein
MGRRHPAIGKGRDVRSVEAHVDYDASIRVGPALEFAQPSALEPATSHHQMGRCSVMGRGGGRRAPARPATRRAFAGSRSRSTGAPRRARGPQRRGPGVAPIAVSLAVSTRKCWSTSASRRRPPTQGAGRRAGCFCSACRRMSHSMRELTKGPSMFQPQTTHVTVRRRMVSRSILD